MNTNGTRMNTDRKLAAWEIASVTVSCLVAEWVVLAFGGDSKVLLAVPVVLALVLMIFSHRFYGESAHELGFRWDNFVPAIKLLALPTIVAVVLIIALSRQFQPRDPLRWRFLLVPLWALFQQYALQAFIN